MTVSAAAGRWRSVAERLRAAESHVRVLRTIDWPAEVRVEFFESDARELPRVDYPRFDPTPTLELIASARGVIERADNPIDDWLARQADAIECGARMLAGVGTPSFYRRARELYGSPAEPLPDDLGTTRDLAQHIDEVFGRLESRIGPPPDLCHTAASVAEGIRAAVESYGDFAPEVVIVDSLSSNARAGSRRISLRRDASFNDRHIAQLVQHELHVHVATSINGRAQEGLPILAAGHPGTTRTQEGLAVFAEMISGAMDIDRMRRLVDRVNAIHMAEEGADFLEVYRFLLERHESEQQAYESARRVFRGGVLTGGAPFTKDHVYLNGLMRVHAFLRGAVRSGRVDCIPLLFCGKLDLADIPALAEAARLGVCSPPRFLPPWARDLRFLVAYLSYTTFFGDSVTATTTVRFSDALAGAARPWPVDGPSASPADR